MESRITIDKRIAHAALHGSADDRELLDPFVAGAISEHLKDVTHEHLKVENESRLLSGYQNAIVECLRKLVPRYPSRTSTCLHPAPVADRRQIMLWLARLQQRGHDMFMGNNYDIWVSMSNLVDHDDEETRTFARKMLRDVRDGPVYKSGRGANLHDCRPRVGDEKFLWGDPVRLRAAESDEWIYGTVSSSVTEADGRESGTVEMYWPDNSRRYAKFARDGTTAIMSPGLIGREAFSPLTRCMFESADPEVRARDVGAKESPTKPAEVVVPSIPKTTADEFSIASDDEDEVFDCVIDGPTLSLSSVAPGSLCAVATVDEILAGFEKKDEPEAKDG